MLFLPAIPGRYSVGVTTLVTPVHRPRPIGNAKVRRRNRKGEEEIQPALFLEEVAYTVYYPAELSSVGSKAKKGIDWFVR
ncbi:hypothetical protein NMY22_g18563 [Coprinellus aureogranulatus]|nr:hypothetical protein NMY22_g18563 [Coprinellus aureogranulatus]